MSGLCDDVKCNCGCRCCGCWRNFMENLGEQRNAIMSLLSGALFALGWWFVIDSNVADTKFSNGAYWVCGVCSTIALFMVNLFSNRFLFESSDGCLGPCGARVVFFLSFGLLFGGLISSIWVMAAEYIAWNKHAAVPRPLWPGVSLFLQNLCIFLSTLLFKFGRSDELD